MSPSKLISFLSTTLLLLLIQSQPTFSQQHYDGSNCRLHTQVPGSNYLCNYKKMACDTYIVYRAQGRYSSLKSIASLFNTDEFTLRSNNNMSRSDPDNLFPNEEIIIPIRCTCLDRFAQAIFAYNISDSDHLSDIACNLFEGLVKAQSLKDENPGLTEGNNPNNSLVQVPVRCACPSNTEVSNGINYLVTYPLVDEDHSSLISSKFNVDENSIWEANKLNPFGTIYPRTTLLIPTNDRPVLNLAVVPPNRDPTQTPKTTIPLSDIVPGTKSNNKKLNLFIGGITSAILGLLVVGCGVFIFIRKRKHHGKFRPLSSRKLQLPQFTPDFLDGMSKLKHPLVCFNLKELRIATDDFSEGSVIGTAVYRGRIGDSYLAIEQMSSMEATHHVIDILTRINHLNVVKLEGCCYGTCSPCLVFEFVENGSLRDCLSNPKIAKHFTWIQRMQIAIDLAEGLQYIQHCTKPSYVHRNINSRNVLITMDWRAKISGFRLARALMTSGEDKEETGSWNESVVVGKKGYLAPEYINYGQASAKVDVYAFGVVLLELLSAKQAITEGNKLRDCVEFLGDGEFEESSGCLEKLKGFMDPALEGDYPLGDAMCIALLAKGCVKENPLLRPTMNDVLKAFSRILS